MFRYGVIIKLYWFIQRSHLLFEILGHTIPAWLNIFIFGVVIILYWFIRTRYLFFSISYPKVSDWQKDIKMRYAGHIQKTNILFCRIITTLYCTNHSSFFSLFFFLYSFGCWILCLMKGIEVPKDLPSCSTNLTEYLKTYSIFDFVVSLNIYKHALNPT